MNVASPHLIRLYIRTSRRYKKLISRLQRKAVTDYQRKTFLSELRKLIRTLRGLHAQLRIAAATGTVALMLNTGTAHAQQVPGFPTSTAGPFVKQQRSANPLREPIFTNNEPALAIVDWDRDGDMDVVIGEASGYGNDFGGYLRYFENISGEGPPLFIERTGDENPFRDIRSQTRGAAPAFADIDQDGDLDLFLSQNGYTQLDAPAPGGIEYFRNDKGQFSEQTGPWDATTKSGNPFHDVSLGPNVRSVFIDFDKDGDDDVMLASTVVPEDGGFNKYFHYYENDGNGSYTNKPVSVDYDPSFPWGPITPALADLDNDGDYDLVVGSYADAGLWYFEQVSPGTFERQFAPWDPATKSGNPFAAIEFDAGPVPAFIDFDQDGNLDLFVAELKYSDRIVNYYKNTGDGIFEEKFGFDNPFDGVFVNAYASPLLIDLDGDGDLDAVVGNKYSDGYYNENQEWVETYSSLRYYNNAEGVYSKADETHPLHDPQLQLNGYFAPQFFDVDGDGDLDVISGDGFGQIAYFRNDAGTYVYESEFSPFIGISVGYAASVKLVDIDNDADADLFLSDGYGDIRYFRNDDGTFVEQFESDHPLVDAIDYTNYRTPFLNFTDIDHDGDLDLFFGGMAGQDNGDLLYFENTGSAEQPLFVTPPLTAFFKGADSYAPQAEFADFDNDGDLDLFVGTYDGAISYFKNENPAVIASATTLTVLYRPGVDGPVVVAPDLTLEDPDEDLIRYAVVSIVDYQPGEILDYTPADGINGSFDTETGTLYLRGTATLETYQNVLRTVTFEYSADTDAARKRSIQATTPKDIAFAVYDIDLTEPEMAIQTVDIFVNSPPEIAPEPTSAGSDFKRTVNLMEITSDVDDNLDPTRFTIVTQPSSGAKASITFVSATEVNLIIDYEGIAYSGLDQLTIMACDDDDACTERQLSLAVDIDTGVTVYNAIAPNSTGDNQFMRISGLPANNTVRIFNRWGDKVYEVEDYQSTPDGNAFRGQNNDGKDLPSGTYFYTLEAPGHKTVTGYLTLRR